MRLKLTLFTLAAALVTSAAHADPCKAIPDHGPAPGYLHPGATFSGKVVYVGDGDSLCVAVGPGPQQWVEVRLADFYAPELHDAGGEQAKATLSRLAYGRQATCIAEHQSYDRMVAACKIDGRSVGDMLRAAGVKEGGRAYPPASSSAAGPAPIVVAGATPRARVSASASYPNCAAARAAGAAPLYRGDPGYSPRLDRDGDGVVCEPYRER
jgi:endonuclease YncB( thermonuclease family)